MLESPSKLAFIGLGPAGRSDAASEQPRGARLRRRGQSSPRVYLCWRHDDLARRLSRALAKSRPMTEDAAMPDDPLATEIFGGRPRRGGQPVSRVRHWWSLAFGAVGWCAAFAVYATRPKPSVG